MITIERTNTSPTPRPAGPSAEPQQHGGTPAPSTVDAYEQLSRGIRDELSTLVATHVVLRTSANDILARLNVPALQTPFVVGVRVPATVSVRARYPQLAQRAAAVQIVTDLNWLRCAYLRGAAPSATAAKNPVGESVLALRTLTADADPGGTPWPRFTIEARVLLAVRVNASDRHDAWIAARNLITADLRQVRRAFTQFDADAMRLGWVRETRTQP